MKKWFDYLWTGLAAIGMFTAFLFTVFTAGYAYEKYTVTNRSDRCINSACVDPCKPSARFKRHAGCVE